MPPEREAPLRAGITIRSRSPADTARLAARILHDLPDRRVLALHGDLGAGKTCFVRGLARALGCAEAVTSPTFTIMREYPGQVRLIHGDLYRIQTPDELLAIGFEDWFAGDSCVAIEWAERAGDLLPADALHLHFKVDADTDQRRITLA